MSDLLIETFGDRTICIKGVGKSFYQDGFPISLSIAEFKKQGIEVSMLHMVEEFWNNGWSWETIESKLLGEIDMDINKDMDIDIEYLHIFYTYLEQPLRGNGGYEKSREMIFQYLFNVSTDDVRNDKSEAPKNWLVSRLTS